jgi:DNA (cytosine-5)-methyltransferase 1
VSVYYNEIDRFAAEWLRELIKAGLIAAGDVDTRDIREVKPDELQGYTQHHFFAGIGGWSYALRLAGWPAERRVWTASCPCPPFSCAGKKQTCPECERIAAIPHPFRTGVFVCSACEHEWYADARHLWPEVLRLAGECRPPVIFGEQVASPDGRVWLAGVRATLEDLGYGVGGADLCAAGVGAPDIRQRLWWVADAGRGVGCEGVATSGPDQSETDAYAQRRGENGGLGDSAGARPQGARPEILPGLCEQQPAESGFWCDFDLVPCSDGKVRRIEPGTFPLADGVPARMGRLRGYGNAIVPQVAAEFIRAYLECERSLT